LIEKLNKINKHGLEKSNEIKGVYYSVINENAIEKSKHGQFRYAACCKTLL
jgi:hypothetical protein